MIKLIVGLGNKGSSYAATRHNAGAWLIEAAVKQYGLTLRPEKKFRLEVAEYQHAGQKIYFAKTTGYMNESGLPIVSFAKFHTLLSSEILVIHDELDFEPGVIKLKLGGGHAGHNGLRDIISHLGSPDFYRLRVGIGHPGSKEEVVSYVLQAPSRDDKIEIANALDRGLKALPNLMEGRFEI